MIQGIDAVILWPRKPQLEPRLLKFRLGAVNVVTGYSSKGKSAILWIVDFCLASSKCSIPIGAIRQAVSHVGVRFRTSKGYLTLVRPVPLGSSQSAEKDQHWKRIAWHESPDNSSLPEVPGIGETLQTVRRRLDELVGLPDLPMHVDEYGEKVGFGERPGFRDLMAFLLQPQSLVANANALFHKADEYAHRERLKYVLPLVLGLTNAKTLADQFRESWLKAEEKRLSAEQEREVKGRAAVAERLTPMVLRLQEAGVVDQSLKDDERTAHGLANDLLVRLAAFRQSPTFQSIKGQTDVVSGEIAQRTHRIELVGRELADARRRLSQLTRVTQAAAEYQSSQQAGKEFLRSWDKLNGERQVDSRCPLCGSVNDAAVAGMAEMQSLRDDLVRLADDAASVSTGAQRAVEEQRKRVRHLENDLIELREQLKILAVNNDSAPQSYEAIGLLLGEAEYLCRQVLSTGSDSQTQRLAEIRSDLERVKARLSAAKSQAGTKQKLTELRERITFFANLLKLERADDSATIDLKGLTVAVGAEDDQDVLSDIGSAANWMGYHIAAMLGLHEQMLTTKERYVPSFLMVDQFSQAYFPADPVDAASVDKRLAQARDEDLEGVRRVFEAMTKAVQRTQGHLQIIVVEHAGPKAWGKLPIELVKDWHGADALVPQEWL